MALNNATAAAVCCCGAAEDNRRPLINVRQLMRQQRVCKSLDFYISLFICFDGKEN